MAKIIEARVIQKIDTEQNWNANELILYKGEIALVGDPDRVYNIKVGNGVKKFRDLPYMVNYVNGLYTGVITPQSQVPSGVNNVFLVTQPGTYTNFGGVVLPKDNLGIIYKNGNNFTIQLIPIVSEEKLQEYIDEKLVDINVGFGGEITDLNQSPNVQGMYIPKLSGVYPNFGDLEYNPIEGFTLFLYKDSQFSKITIPLSSVENTIDYKNSILGVSGKAVELHSVKKINTIADLRNTQGEYEGQVIELLGYFSAGDKNSVKYRFSNDLINESKESIIVNGWVFLGENISFSDFGIFNTIDDSVNIDEIINLIILYNKILIIDKNLDITKTIDFSKVNFIFEKDVIINIKNNIDGLIFEANKKIDFNNLTINVDYELYSNTAVTFNGTKYINESDFQGKNFYKKISNLKVINTKSLYNVKYGNGIKFKYDYDTIFMFNDFDNIICIDFLNNYIFDSNYTQSTTWGFGNSNIFNIASWDAVNHITSVSSNNIGWSDAVINAYIQASHITEKVIKVIDLYSTNLFTSYKGFSTSKFNLCLWDLHIIPENKTPNLIDAQDGNLYYNTFDNGVRDISKYCDISYIDLESSIHIDRINNSNTSIFNSRFSYIYSLGKDILPNMSFSESVNILIDNLNKSKYTEDFDIHLNYYPDGVTGGLLDKILPFIPKDVPNSNYTRGDLTIKVNTLRGVVTNLKFIYSMFNGDIELTKTYSVAGSVESLWSIRGIIRASLNDLNNFKNNTSIEKTGVYIFNSTDLELYYFKNETTYDKVQRKSSLVNSVTANNAEDLPTALTLINEQKTIINDLIAKMKSAGLMSNT